jgi:putative radical SAM enzyme (TIGR03279 family)
VALLKDLRGGEKHGLMCTTARESGIRVCRVRMHSAAYRAGIRPGDRICLVNNEPVEHELDFSFLTAVSQSAIVVRRAGTFRKLVMKRADGTATGAAFSPTPIRRCRNRCIFCFVDQLPKGMRPRLYIKDEDYRDLRVITRFGLSPLYVSVHATDRRVRAAMLRNRLAAPIMQQLVFLQRHGIRFHTQIVVCPGVNDAKVLKRTLGDLCRLRTGMLSCAVVPVGLTRFHRNGLLPVSARQARRIVAQVSRLSERDRQDCGARRIFLADELYLKAGLRLPPHMYYRDYPQIENGVGLLRTLLFRWQILKRSLCRHRVPLWCRPAALSPARIRCCVVTSRAAFPYIDTVASGLSEIFPRVSCRAVAVENRFFGPGVTVAGLLTGRDIVRTLRAVRPKPSFAVVPRVVLNYRGYTLDGYSAKRMSRRAGQAIRVAADLEELVSLVRDRAGETAA